MCSIVEFASSRDVKRAIDKLDGTEINGRKIRLIEDKPRKRRRYVNQVGLMLACVAGVMMSIFRVRMKSVENLH